MERCAFIRGGRIFHNPVSMMGAYSRENLLEEELN